MGERGGREKGEKRVRETEEKRRKEGKRADCSILRCAFNDA